MILRSQLSSLLKMIVGRPLEKWRSWRAQAAGQIEEGGTHRYVFVISPRVFHVLRPFKGRLLPCPEAERAPWTGHNLFIDAAAIADICLLIVSASAITVRRRWCSFSATFGTSESRWGARLAHHGVFHEHEKDFHGVFSRLLVRVSRFKPGLVRVLTARAS